MARRKSGVTLLALAGLIASVAACSSNSSNAGGQGTVTSQVATVSSTAPSTTALQPSSASSQGSTSAVQSATSTTASAIPVPDKYKKDGIVVVTSGGSTPPISYIDPDKPDSHLGFDPDIARAVGEVLGVDVKFESLAFSGMIPGVQSGRFDLAMFGITDTAAREEQVDLIDYIQAGVGIIVPKGNPKNIKSLDDLCGKTVAVLSSGATADVALAQAKKCTMTVNQFQEKADAFLQLKTGRADASMDGMDSALYLDQHPTDSTKDLELVKGVDLNVAPRGIVVSKNATELRDAVTAALEVLVENGTYQKLLEKWSLTGLAIDKIAVNAATK